MNQNTKLVESFYFIYIYYIFIKYFNNFDSFCFLKIFLIIFDYVFVLFSFVLYNL